MMHLMCYLRDGDRTFETYWTTRRGAEAMDYSYALMDLTVYGRQEPWEDLPPGWPQQLQVDGSSGQRGGDGGWAAASSRAEGTSGLTDAPSPMVATRSWTL